MQSFVDKYPLVGPTIWMLAIQYYITQIIVAMAWLTPYSWLHNTISDLGNTVCGFYTDRYVCSQSHALMNGSFILLGVIMVVGAGLIYHEFKQTKASAIGFSFMGIAGLGTLLVGFYPENVNLSLHVLGAALVFFIGNIGLLILGRSLPLPQGLRLYTLFSGTISLIALVLLGSHNYLGLGIGGMERIVAYPQTLWLIVFGIYISRNHIMKNMAAKQVAERAG